MGRPVEAVETWNRALAIDPTFPMAKGNRGLGFVAYAGALYDDGHRHILFAAAHRDLEGAIRHQNRLEKDAMDGFPKTLADLRRALGANPSKFLDVPSFSLGQSAAEQRYRKWCLDRQLFLNPLNDAGNWTVAATDVLGLPTMTSDDYQPGEWIAVFNQIKQEYASARFLLFEGLPNRFRRDSLLELFGKAPPISSDKDAEFLLGGAGTRDA